MNRVEKIKELIAAYTAGLNKFNRARVELCANWLSKDTVSVYNPDYIVTELYKRLDDIDTCETQAFNKLNELLKEELSALRVAIRAKFYPPFEKATEAQVNNALTLINTLGNEITEADLSSILSPFSSDYEQMRIFQRVVSVVKEGAQTAPVFDKVTLYTKKLEDLASADSIATFLFINPRIESKGTGFNGRWFVTEYAGTYAELDGHSRIVKCVEEIESTPE